MQCVTKQTVPRTLCCHGIPWKCYTQTVVVLLFLLTFAAHKDGFTLIYNAHSYLMPFFILLFPSLYTPNLLFPTHFYFLIHKHLICIFPPHFYTLIGSHTDICFLYGNCYKTHTHATSYILLRNIFFMILLQLFCFCLLYKIHVIQSGCDIYTMIVQFVAIPY